MLPLSKEYDSDSNVYTSQANSTLTSVRYIQKDMDGWGSLNEYYNKITKMAFK
jgi:hypothetical protein